MKFNCQDNTQENGQSYHQEPIEKIGDGDQIHIENYTLLQ
jgi:hypothetical protein